jgi:hypothetical protein
MRFVAGIASKREALLLGIAVMAGWFAVATVAADFTVTNASTNGLADLMQNLKFRPTGPDTFVLGKVTLNKKESTLRFPAVVNMNQFVIEYALVTKQGKTHESLLATEVSPREVHLASLLLGVIPSTDLGPPNLTATPPVTAKVAIEVSWVKRGKRQQYALAELIGLGEREPGEMAGKLPAGPWLYNGSMTFEGRFLADEEGSIISLIRDPAALINNPHADRDNDDIHWPIKALAPPIGTPVEVLFRFKVAEPTSAR